MWLILSNCVLKDSKALCSMKKTFDILMNMNGNPIWQDTLCKFRTDDIHDLLQLGKEIKIFLKKYEWVQIS